MDCYNLHWRKSAWKDFLIIPKKIREPILTAVELQALTPRPFHCKKIKGEQHCYRIRIGDYRVLYEIEDVSKMVKVSEVRHRKDVYRHL